MHFLTLFLFYFVIGLLIASFRHILALYSAKMVSHATNNRLEVQLHNRTEGSAIFITPSNPGMRDSPAMAVEQMIEAHFLGEAGYLT